MKKIYHIILILALVAICGCQQKETPAPDPVGDLKAHPGIGRVMLEFITPENAVSGKVYYNSGTVKKFFVDPTAPVQVVEVDGLTAGENTLRVVTQDISGRESLPKGIVVDVYGESFYPGALPNRKFVKMREISGDSIEITFEKGGEEEAYVVVVYSDFAGQLQETTVAPDQTTVKIEGADLDLPVTYYTVYKPTEDFLDEYVSNSVNVQDAALMQLDKSIWLMTATGEASDAPLTKVVDGSAKTSWRAAAAGDQTITIDMQGTKLFSGVILSQGWDFDAGTMAGHVAVDVSDDGNNWENVLDKKFLHNCFAQEFPFAKGIKAQYLRITLSYPIDNRPIQLGEIDLYNDLFNTCVDEVQTMPKLINSTVPIQGDGSEDLGTPVGVGRMQRAVGWNTSDNTIITTDTAVGGLCIFSANAWGIPDVVNGKVWQTVELMPGYYSLDWEIGSITDNRGLDAYGVVAKGFALPDIDVATSDASVVASAYLNNYKASTCKMEFDLREPATITVGWVFSTHDLYVITGSIPWSDLYINSIELNTR